MQVVILAGGLGTRIKDVSGDRPKALVPVNGVPFIFYQIEWLWRNGITNLLLSVGYGADQIRAAVTQRYPTDRIEFCDEGRNLLGTAGALKLASERNLLQKSFVLLYGDSYLPIEIEPLWRTSECGLLPTMSILRNEGRWDRSNVIVLDGRIVLYDKRVQDPIASGMTHIDYGLLVLQRDLVDERVPTGTVMDLADILTLLSRAGQLNRHEVHETFYEIGSVVGLARFESYVAAHPSIRPADQ